MVMDRAFAAAEARLLHASQKDSRSLAGDKVQERVKALRAGAYGPAFQTTAAPHFNDAYELLREVAADLASALGIAVPEFERFFAAGLSETPALAEADAALVPVLAPHGVGLSAWCRISGVGGGDLLPQIEVSTEALRWGAALDRPAAKLQLPTRTPGSQARAVRWTLRWVPAENRPGLRGEAYRAGAHATLPEMLVLQAARARLGVDPVDTAAFTWLYGELPDSSLAARHTFDVYSGTIRISTRARTDRGQHVGVRLAQEPFSAKLR